MNPFFEKINNNTVALVGLIVFLLTGAAFGVSETLTGAALGALVTFLRGE